MPLILADLQHLFAPPPPFRAVKVLLKVKSRSFGEETKNSFCIQKVNVFFQKNAY